MKTIFLALYGFLLALPAVAQQKLLNPREFLGYELGDRFTRHHRVVDYFKQVADVMPNVDLVTYGETYEHRALVYAVVTAPENFKNLEQIRTDNLKRAGVIDGTPSADKKAIVWLSYNVHGNEANSMEASMQTLYELANTNNSKTQEWLKNTVVILDPCINPDGRDRYAIQGNLVRQLTSGDFEVSEFLGLDEKNKLLYFTSTETSALERHLYTLTLDGKKKTKLSTATGWHTINLSGDYQFYIDYHNSTTQPTVVNLYKTKGNALIKTLEKNEALAKTAQEYGLAQKEFFSFKTVDGTSLNGFMLKPKNLDAGKQYPVLLYQYSGPGSQNVTNAWGGSHFYFHQMLVQKGYIVAVIDTRGTGGRGEKFKKLTYKQLGKYELEDHIAGAKFLASLEYVDDSRIGIWGWSYGGYMASLAMTKGAGAFKTGVAVAPVTNWRFYDNIYTERFLQTPQLNAAGYDDNSPVTYAANLKGNFLLIHGTGDDNVHFQNSVQFEEALINAGKQFRSFYYPDKNHGIPGAKTRFHLYTMMIQYIQENL